MLCTLKNCCRSINKSAALAQLRNYSQANFGRDGHYDIIIVGGGATGISLAGAIGNIIAIKIEILQMQF